MKLGKVIRAIAAVVVLILAVLAVDLWLRPPDLLRVAANYAAKIVCSNVFLAGRDPDEVLRVDVQAPGLAVLRLMRVSVDREHQVVHAGLFGFIGQGLAVARPQVGCAVVPDGNLGYATHASLAPAAAAAQSGSAGDAVWPDGNTVNTKPALDRLLMDDGIAGPGVRAIVVVDHGHIVAERYAPGFLPSTPLLGWSMTKTVMAGLVGELVQDGRLTLDQPAGWAAGDGRERIHISDLLDMSSGLQFNEPNGLVSDLTRMLYLSPDMAGFARAQPLAHPVGEVWSYSSGTANIVSRIVQDAAAPLGAAYPAEKLFKPLGMKSAVMETDEYGTLVGSSYMYATARDWARYGQFLAQDGLWNGQRFLPEGYVAMMAMPVAASEGQYGQGFVWLFGSDAATPGKNPDAAFGIPPDTFWMLGHDGQSTAIIRSRQLVIVRLGLTPVSLHYSPQRLVNAVLAATQQ